MQNMHTTALHPAPCLHATAHQRLHACLAVQAYVGCPEFLTEFKDYGALTEDQVDFNKTTTCCSSIVGGTSISSLR